MNITWPLLLTKYEQFGLSYLEPKTNKILQWLGHVRGMCENVPIVLVGLKKDLRPFCPTLRLRFLNEPVAVTQGQVCYDNGSDSILNYLTANREK